MRQVALLTKVLRPLRRPTRLNLKRYLARRTGDGSREDLNAQSTSYGANTGFGFASPAELRDIVKIELLEQQETSEIKKIWLKQFKKDELRAPFVFSEEQWQTLKKRLAENKMFIFPTPWKQKYFVLVSQQLEKHIFFVPVEAYQKDINAASPYVSLSFYNDFVHDHGIVLARAEIINLARMTKDNMMFLLGEFFHYYTDDEAYRLVHQFNHDSKNFDVDAHMQRYPFTQNFFVQNEQVGRLFVRDIAQDGSVQEADEETAENEHKVLKSHAQSS